MGITYYSNRAGTNTVPTPLKAGTIKRLQRAMLALNRKVRGVVFYMGPPQWVESEKAWVVWYYIEQTIEEQLQGVDSGDN